MVPGRRATIPVGQPPAPVIFFDPHLPLAGAFPPLQTPQSRPSRSSREGGADGKSAMSTWSRRCSRSHPEGDKAGVAVSLRPATSVFRRRPTTLHTSSCLVTPQPPNPAQSPSPFAFSKLWARMDMQPACVGLVDCRHSVSGSKTPPTLSLGHERNLET